MEVVPTYQGSKANHSDNDGCVSGLQIGNQLSLPHSRLKEPEPSEEVKVVNENENG